MYFFVSNFLIFDNFDPIFGPPLHFFNFFSTDNNLSCLLYSRLASFYNFLCIFLGQIAYNTNFLVLKKFEKSQICPNFIHFGPICSPIYPLNGTKFQLFWFLYFNKVILLCFLIKIIHNEWFNGIQWSKNLEKPKICLTFIHVGPICGLVYPLNCTEFKLF